MKRQLYLGLLAALLMVVLVAAVDFSPNRNIDNTGYNVSADFFIGDGSQLTNVQDELIENSSGTLQPISGFAAFDFTGAPFYLDYPVQCPDNKHIARVYANSTGIYTNCTGLDLIAGSGVTIEELGNGSIQVNATATGSFDGTGITSRVAQFQDSDTLNTSIIYTDKDSVSVGAATSFYGLDHRHAVYWSSTNGSGDAVYLAYGNGKGSYFLAKSTIGYSGFGLLDGSNNYDGWIGNWDGSDDLKIMVNGRGSAYQVITVDTATYNVTFNKLGGTGNAFACLDSNGKLYRSASACA